MTDEKTFKVFIEIPQGSSIKYEVDEETGELKVDRFLYTSFVYPFNYGFIKDTKAEDGDPVDVVVLSMYPVAPGVTMKCKAIGVLGMEDEEGPDDKILVVPVKKVDPDYGTYTDIKDVPEALLNKIKHFFENYKTLEPNKWVKVTNFKGRAEAEAEIAKASK
jgi:inorganic pyrophosphatase